MKQNSTWYGMGILFFLLWMGGGRGLYAQDVLPLLSHPMEPLRIPLQPEQLWGGRRLIPVSDSMPASFRHTAENVIADEHHSLFAFFQKLYEKQGPVRIVHIGDSHVRGHLYPYVVRQELEQDFGAEAVYPEEVSYRTSGLARETGQPGLVYHILGVNGATTVTFCTEQKIREVSSLKPDLIILSFGTNEAHSRRYLAPAHRQQVDDLVSRLQRACPQASFLLTTPPGAYVGRRRSRTINPRTVTAARMIREYAADKRLAVWDLYSIVGGKANAVPNWSRSRLLRADGIHFTPEGYRLQGNLLHQAFIKAYNEYVATGLD